MRPIIVWVASIALLISLLPLVVATVWAPKCASCHTEQKSIAQNSFHSDLSCEQCHVSGSWTKRVGMRSTVMYQMVLPLGELDQSMVEKVSTETCLECHEDSNNSGAITHRGIKINHTECISNLECSTCHTGMGHQGETMARSGYTMNSCLRCHAKAGVSATGGCVTCHDGESAKNRNKKITSFSVTHSANWKQTHGMGDPATCTSCHNSSDCARCHGAGVPHQRGFFSQHSGYAQEKSAKCEMCHDDKKFCFDCHGTEIPHPETFLAEHSQIVNEGTDEKCYNCHKQTDCTACHSAHIHPGGAKL